MVALGMLFHLDVQELKPVAVFLMFLVIDVLSNSPDFAFHYNLALDRTLGYYASFLQVERPTSSKTSKFLTDKAFRDRYRMPALPDTKFSTLFLFALESQETKNIEKLILHAQKEMGGFNIDGWKLKSKVEE